MRGLGADPKLSARLADLGGYAAFLPRSSPVDFGMLIAEGTPEKWAKVVSSGTPTDVRRRPINSINSVREYPPAAVCNESFSMYCSN